MIRYETDISFGRFKYIWLIPATKDRYDWNTRWTGILSKKIEKNGIEL